jgi:hypothetical protein
VAANRLRLREEVSGSVGGWALKLRGNTVSEGAYRAPEPCASGGWRQPSEGLRLESGGAGRLERFGGAGPGIDGGLRAELPDGTSWFPEAREIWLLLGPPGTRPAAKWRSPGAASI